MIFFSFRGPECADITLSCLLVDTRKKKASCDEEDDERKNPVPLLACYERHDTDEERADDRGELPEHIEEAVEL